MPVVFDIRTLLFVGAIAALACGVMLWLCRGMHAPSRAGLLWAAAAQASFGAAMLLIALRGWVPDVLSWPVANALGSGAAALMYEGVRRMVGARPMPGLAAATGLALAGVHAGLGTDLAWYELRLQLTSVVQGGFTAAAVPLLLRRLRAGEDPPLPLRWAIGFCATFGLAHAVRFVATATFGANVAPTGLVDGPLHMLVSTLFTLAPMGYALVLIGLVNARLSAELWALATVDTLTGVRTRRSFIEEARRALAAPGARPVLLILDLDRFKQVNDRYGHASGDLVLARFAALLRESAPRGAVAGRYGGEEFCLLLPDCAPDAGRAHAQRLCDAVRATAFGIDRPDPTLTVSIGLAAATDGTTLEELLLAADRRLYAAKASGRDRVVSSDRTLAADVAVRLATLDVSAPLPVPPAGPLPGPVPGAGPGVRTAPAAAPVDGHSLPA